MTLRSARGLGIAPLGGPAATRLTRATSETVAKLHDVLQRAALHELHRRRGQLRALGPEFDDVAQQCADDAMVNILAKIDDFRGLSRFTTWAYKFAIFEVSSKVARHAWQHHRRRERPRAGTSCRTRSSPKPARRPSAASSSPRSRTAIATELTPRQREVFVAIALNDVSIDVLALQLDSNRNALYKNLFDARRKLRACLAAAGHPLSEEDA